MALKSPFYAGKAVTADYLNSSQYFGPANPGVSFVAVPTQFWEYPLLTVTSIDQADFDARYITRNGNVTIGGVKTFTTSPQVPTASPGDSTNNVASTAFVIAELSSTITNGNFVDIGTAQNITGLKTFSAVNVPLVPAGLASPVSLQYADNNYVDVNTNGTIAGTKTFVVSPEVPVPTIAPAATPKSYVDGLVAGLTSGQTTLQAAVAALQTVAQGLTVVTGTYPGNTYTSEFFVVIFPGNFKMLVVGDAGGPAQIETITFPSVAQGFVGFANPPIVIATGLGASQVQYTPMIDAVTPTTFIKRNETFGGGSGSAINFVAFGI